MNFNIPTNPKDCWMTPQYILDAVTVFFDGYWFDPCPHEADFDGLAMAWPAKCYINPPFSQYKVWAAHGLQQPGEQIWICHHDSSTERFQMLANKASAICLLYERVSFIHPETLQPKGTDPAKSQTLIYRGDFPYSFKDSFRHLGLVMLTGENVF